MAGPPVLATPQPLNPFTGSAIVEVLASDFASAPVAVANGLEEIENTQHATRLSTEAP